MAEVKAKYKVHNGSSWDTIYFKTTADQIIKAQYSGTNYYRTVFDTRYMTVNGKTFEWDSTNSRFNGVTLSGGDIKVTANSGYANTNTIDAVIKDLLDRVKEVEDMAHIEKQGILTTSNYATTLDSVYLGKTAKAADADKLDGNDSTYFAKATDLTSHTSNTSNPHSVSKSQVGLGNVVNKGMDTTPTSGSENYVNSGGVYTALAGKVPTTRTVNGKALSGNIVLYSDNISLSSSDSTSIKTAIDNVVAVANGKSNTYVVNLDIDADEFTAILADTTNTYYDKLGNEMTAEEVISYVGGAGAHILNPSLNSNSNEIITSYTSFFVTDCGPKNANGSYTGSHFKIIRVNTNPTQNDLEIGDVLYTPATGVPDRWFGGILESIGPTFYKMETQSVDLTDVVHANDRLITNKIVLGDGGKKVKPSSYGIGTTTTTDTANVTTGKNVHDMITAHLGVDKTGTVTSVEIAAGAGLSVDSTAAITGSGKRTISHSNSTTAKNNVGGSTNESPAYGSTFSVPYFSYDAQGHITGSGVKVVKIPAADNTNTFRPIQLNGTQKLAANSTTALNFKTGTNVTITESSGSFTFNAIVTVGTTAPTAINGAVWIDTNN